MIGFLGWRALDRPPANSIDHPQRENVQPPRRRTQAVRTQNRFPHQRGRDAAARADAGWPATPARRIDKAWAIPQTPRRSLPPRAASPRPEGTGQHRSIPKGSLRHGIPTGSPPGPPDDDARPLESTPVRVRCAEVVSSLNPAALTTEPRQLALSLETHRFRFRSRDRNAASCSAAGHRVERFQAPPKPSLARTRRDTASPHASRLNPVPELEEWTFHREVQRGSDH